MQGDRDHPRSADEVREREELSEEEVRVRSDKRHPNDPIGGSAYGGDMMLPPTGDLLDPAPSSGMPGEPPPPDRENDEGR